jgi:hypothetical protein
MVSNTVGQIFALSGRPAHAHQLRSFSFMLSVNFQLTAVQGQGSQGNDALDKLLDRSNIHLKSQCQIIETGILDRMITKILTTGRVFSIKPQITC